MPAKLNFFKTLASVRLVSSRSASTSTGISGCFQPGQAKVVSGPTPLPRTQGMEGGGGEGVLVAVYIFNPSCTIGRSEMPCLLQDSRSLESRCEIPFHSTYQHKLLKNNIVSIFLKYSLKLKNLKGRLCLYFSCDPPAETGAVLPGHGQLHHHLSGLVSARSVSLVRMLKGRQSEMVFCSLHNIYAKNKGSKRFFIWVQYQQRQAQFVKLTQRILHMRKEHFLFERIVLSSRKQEIRKRKKYPALPRNLRKVKNIYLKCCKFVKRLL